MHKIINKKSIQKITAIIIIMIMCNFIMSTKVWAVEKWMSLEEYEKLTVGSMDIKQEVSATSQAVKNLANKWNITPEQALEVIKNHATEANTLGIMEEMADTGTTYSVYNIKLQPTEEEIKKYNIPVDDDGYASADTSYWSNTSTGLEGETSAEDAFAGTLAKPLVALVLGMCDGVNELLQTFLIGDNSSVFESRGKLTLNQSMMQIVTDNQEESGLGKVSIVKEYLDVWNGGYGLPNIKLTPAEIFTGNVSSLDANFFKTESDHDKELGGSEKSIVEQLKETVATWYVALRNIAIVGLLSALLYIGIRIVISSSAGDKAKYKQFFVDWVVALCLIFFMHYIMAFTMTMSETVTDVLAGNNTNQGRIKEVNIELTGTDGKSLYEEGGTPIAFSSNFTGVVRIKATYQGISLKLGYSILYIALTGYTVYFSFVYLKRLLMLAFFTMIAPLVALTYPLDKIKDGKAQAFNYWFKEYMFYALLQPLHMLLYKVFVSSALSVAANNLLYAIVAIAFIVPAEKIVKQMFGIKGNTEDKLGGFAGGALASQAFNMLKKGPPPQKKGGDGPKGEKGVRFSNPNKANAMDTLADDAMGLNHAESAAQTATAAGAATVAGAATAQNDTDNERPVSEMSLDEIAAMQEQNGQVEAPQEQNGQLEAGQTATEAGQQQDSDTDNGNTDKDKFKAVRDEKLENFKTAANVRWQKAGGLKGIGTNVAKTGAKLAVRGATMAGMGMIGLGLGAVSGDMGDMFKGMAAGATAGYAAGGRLSSAVGNISQNVGNTALGSFISDTVNGFGPEKQRNDYIKSYMSSKENRNRLIDKNPTITKSELDAQLRQRAELSYDSGVTDAKMLDRAVKLQKQLDEKNPRGVGNAERHGANYDKTVATMQLASKYSDSTFETDDKIAKAQNRLANKLERNMTERTNGPINAETARQMKSKANAEAAETMNNIDYLKNG
ncbi:MAG: pilin [Clostridia bacterium]|mgnify:FL=1